eukprot:364191-Chlamydomonas_euryale.AAC.9
MDAWAADAWAYGWLCAWARGCMGAWVHGRTNAWPHGRIRTLASQRVQGRSLAQFPRIPNSAWVIPGTSSLACQTVHGCVGVQDGGTTGHRDVRMRRRACALGAGGGSQHVHTSLHARPLAACMHVAKETACIQYMHEGSRAFIPT